MDVVDEIREAIEGKAALLLEGNAEAVMSHYAPSFVEYTLAPPLRQAGEAATQPRWRRGWPPSRLRPAVR
jgi:ketosteroid isomerase-like protein